ncbi:MAG: phosphatidylserine decarboxylase family protein [Planctomycetota bacterium]|nr:MAG: phosphatidylserine decarboxylase family protein [Planctomycetota bacterium]
MRIPLTPSGGRAMALMTLLLAIPAAIAWVAAGMGYVWCWPIAGILTLAWLAGLAFFRDPQRKTPKDTDILVAPADGKVVETARLDHHQDIGGPAIRIGIFLSVLDVHINRSPCAGIVRSIQYQPGRFLDARNPEAGRQNEANAIVIEPDQPHTGPIIVRQIAGLIARRIVCSLKVGDRLQTGQRIGMIKFGSRTELIVPGHDNYTPSINLGEKAYGALTIMARRTKSTVIQNRNHVIAETKQYA